MSSTKESKRGRPRKYYKDHDLTFPSWSKPLFKPKRYKIAYGGRGSGKSYTFTDALIVRAIGKRTRILCAREFQSSISESVHRLIVKRIEDLGFKALFTVTRDAIRCLNGSEFVFKGLHHNVDQIKSMAGVDVCWVEEAQSTSKESLGVLIPTIREPDSEIWMTLNPRLESDPVYQTFIADSHPDAYLMKVNYSENKHFPAVLDAERRLMLERDPALYRHVWEGECLSQTDAQIFKDKWQVQDFTPTADWGAPLYGLDWGFSQDPTACVKVYAHDETLYIEKEAVKIGLDLDDTAQFVMHHMPEIKEAVIRADCARPESIRHISQDGALLNRGIPTRPCLQRIQAVNKWKGSVEDGIQHMRAYKRIVVHPRCSEAIKEFTLYSYKVDKRTDDILRDIVDKHNHVIDAIRYAVDPLIERKSSILDAF